MEAGAESADAATYVAIYAAVVATAAFVWNVAQAIRARRRDVLVTMRLAWSDEDGDLRRTVAVTIINRGQIPVGVGGVGVLDQDDPYGPPLTGLPTPNLPPVLAPGAGATAHIRQDWVVTAGGDLARPLTAWVELDSGEHVYSKAVALVALPERSR
jgi:hypothetical protein